MLTTAEKIVATYFRQHDLEIRYTLADAWIIFTDDLASSNVPEMYEQLKRRLG
jgi:hypothetical protein